MERLGVPREQLARAAQGQPAEEAEQPIGIAPHLVQAVELFASLRSQWRTASAGMGGFVFTGLDYSAVEPAMRLLGIRTEQTAPLFARLRLMEMEALRAMNER